METQWVMQGWHFWVVVGLFVVAIIHLATIADHLKKFNEKFTDRLSDRKKKDKE